MEAILKKGSNGVFEITLDGKLIFSKMKLGRFPEQGEMVQLITQFR